MTVKLCEYKGLKIGFSIENNTVYYNAILEALE